MFSLMGTGGSLLKGRHDTRQIRSAPAVIGTVELLDKQSAHGTSNPQRWGDEVPPPDLVGQYVNVRRPSDISLENIRRLNMEITEDHDIEELIRDLPRGGQYLPPQEWLDLTEETQEEPRPASYAAATSANSHNEPRPLLPTGRPAPTKEDFVTRLKEILYDNQDAFSSLTRAPLPESKKIRLAFFRRFWEGLDNMAYYWDTSLDEYLPPDEDETEGSQVSVANHGAQNSDGTQPGTSTAKTAEPHSISRDVSLAVRESSPRKKHKPAPTESTEVPEQPEAQNANGSRDGKGTRYRGNRLGGPLDMPPPYISDTTRGFLEACTWPYGFTLSPPRRPPVLTLDRLRLPVRLSGAVWHPPNDRALARQGWLLGPVVGWSARTFEAGISQDPVNSAEPKPANPEGTFQHASLLETLREIGVLLALAQERSREGLKETLPGEGQWWTTQPRWGGGPGGEVGEGAGTADEFKSAVGTGTDEDIHKSSAATSLSKLAQRKTKRKTSAIDAWKTVKPGSGYWDPRAEYRRVGVAKESDWDDVFLISTLHTHISILHIRVHKLYIEYLTTGKVPPSSSMKASQSQRHWSQPRLRRSRWYNFFSKDDRVAVFRGLWALFGSMSRVVDEDNPKAKDIVMKEG